VIVSSWPLRVNEAALPFTVSLLTLNPRRSRLKLDRSCVARALMVASPASCSFCGS
jgi:hypothetical protein